MAEPTNSRRELLEEIILLRKELEQAHSFEKRALEAERKLNTAQAIFRAAIEQTPVGYIIADAPEGRIQFASLEALGILARPPSSSQRLDIDKLFNDWQMSWPDGTPYAFHERPLVKAIRDGQESRDVEAIIKNQSGEERWVRVNAAPVLDHDGKLVAGVVVFQDITQLKALEKERARTLSFFAHDLKSPLLAAKGLLARLLNGKAGEFESRQMEYLRVVNAQNDRAVSLAMDFLDVARLGRSGGELMLAPVDLKALLAEMAREFTVRAEAAGLGFIAELPGDLPAITGDEHRLKRAFANLLDNAVRYSTGGEVAVRAGLAGNGRLKVAISDHGPGLSDEDFKHLFEPFQRGSAGKGKEGTGLGLAAVKSIVEAHGGKVSARNRKPGGAEFMVMLPLASCCREKPSL